MFRHILMAAALAATPMIALAQDSDRDLAKEEANRALVVDFYERFFVDHDIAAAHEVIAEDYIQHNPGVPNGREALVSYFTGLFAEQPEARSRVVRSAANDDLVWLHVHSTTGADDPGRAIVDIFRVEDGQIVEHWDVIQPVPLEAANDNTMF